VGHADVVDARRRDGEIGRDGAVGVEVDVQLHQRAVRLIVGPGTRHVGQTDAARIDEVDGLARGTAQTGAGLRGEHGEQVGKQLCRALGVGVGQRRAGRCRGAEMIEPVLMAGHGLLDLPQALGARKLRIDERNQLAPRRQSAHARVGAVLIHKAVEQTPRHELQQLMQQAIVMPHGAEPFLCPSCRQALESQLNQRHALCPPKLNRTAVGQARG
jgi:hypothetical protein